MNILQAINSTNPAGGGPIESIVQAHRALKDGGHEIEVVCLDAPDSPWLAQLPFKTTALGPVITPYRYSPRYEPWLRAHAGDYDCVVVHGVWLHPSVGAWRALRGTATPYFVYAHGMLDPALHRLFPAKHLVKSILWRLAEHRVVRDARAVFFTCEEERLLAQRSFRPYAAREAIVPYCVGAPPGDAAAQSAAFLAQFPACRGKRLVLFLSRIHPKKGCDLLIQAFARVADRDPALHLVMAGPDPVGWRDPLEATSRRLGIGGRITWTGMLTGDLKWGAFRSAEVFVLPSHQENFGIAVVEALACGAPALISNRVNIWREIENDGAGLARDDSEEGAVALLDSWEAMPADARKQMSERARMCFNSRFRSEEAAANLLRTLRAHGVRG